MGEARGVIDGNLVLPPINYQTRPNEPLLPGGEYPAAFANLPAKSTFENHTQLALIDTLSDSIQCLNFADN